MDRPFIMLLRVSHTDHELWRCIRGINEEMGVLHKDKLHVLGSPLFYLTPVSLGSKGSQKRRLVYSLKQGCTGPELEAKIRQQKRISNSGALRATKLQQRRSPQVRLSWPCPLLSRRKSFAVRKSPTVPLRVGKEGWGFLKVDSLSRQTAKSEVEVRTISSRFPTTDIANLDSVHCPHQRPVARLFTGKRPGLRLLLGMTLHVPEASQDVLRDCLRRMPRTLAYANRIREASTIQIFWSTLEENGPKFPEVLWRSFLQLIVDDNMSCALGMV
ncbi:hypothetical protein BDK51DRAFT_41726 [Blyttiomyces helicus]|uniref:Uncharacterized protein n=1 Tax=Blyttiomyces helicus TaxID=388810 RepID=A0A4P9WCB6_9FUNG|nr:hypothetical protein BDK51DRAFT_41726 [Blyttiomyces helicus]|eukprot:RKO90144.1 hypothetical protein BDK51DRAFT_41726 [Blyttiomyces helicus]